MSACHWCGASTDLDVAIVNARDAVQQGQKVWIAPVIVPRCADCARRHAKHRAADAQARYIRHAQVADVEQLDLDV